MAEPEGVEGALARHKASCDVCAADGSAWASCPEGSRLMTAELQRLAGEYKKRIGPLRYWSGYTRDKFTEWFFEERPSKLWINSEFFGQYPLEIKPPRWEYVKAFAQMLFALF